MRNYVLFMLVCKKTSSTPRKIGFPKTPEQKYPKNHNLRCFPRRAAVLHVLDRTTMRCQDLNWRNIPDPPHPHVVHAIPAVKKWLLEGTTKVLGG